MNLALVDKIANAVLYEGYNLYPYRPSSVKNRQRWTFGGIYPHEYSLTHASSDPWAMQTECLAITGSDRAFPVLDLRVRVLHLLARDVGELTHVVPDLPEGVGPDYRIVDALQVGDRLFQTWQEAVEREVAAADLDLQRLLAQPLRLTFTFPARHELEPLRESPDRVVGVIVREQQSISGAVEIAAVPAGDRLFKITIRILNVTPLDQAGEKSRDEALMRSFASTHAILGVRAGEFVSLLDPPEYLRAAAAACDNIGGWPVLVGEAGERDTMLASPIILYDYPQIAPESPGDLFDGTEIDEILTLRIMTMTDEEKREMRAVDERSRALLDRTESLAREQLMRLHGTVRGLWPSQEEP
jgi:hydrogenase maturation protease